MKKRSTPILHPSKKTGGVHASAVFFTKLLHFSNVLRFDTSKQIVCNCFSKLPCSNKDAVLQWRDGKDFPFKPDPSFGMSFNHFHYFNSIQLRAFPDGIQNSEDGILTSRGTVSVLWGLCVGLCPQLLAKSHSGTNLHPFRKTRSLASYSEIWIFIFECRQRIL